MSLRCKRDFPTWSVVFGIVMLTAGVCLAGPTEKSKKSWAKKPATTKSSTDDNEKALDPQVEVYIPSAARLAAEFQQSRTFKLYKALSVLMPSMVDETGEGFDVQALIQLFKKTTTWPDTSISVFTYTQDRDGRPRWMVRFDWPLEDLQVRVAEILNDEAAQKILRDIALKRLDDGSYQIELPDTIVAVLRKTEGGSLVASAADLEPPEKTFGRKTGGSSKKKTKTSLLYCLLNLQGGDEEKKGGSVFSQIAGISDIRYAASVGDDGLWNERFNIRWNPFLGMALKAFFKKASASFECPKESYAVAALHLGMAEGMADGLADLPAETIGTRADGEFAIAVLPGTGFLPLPDLYYQFHAQGEDKIIRSIRKALREDAKKRRVDDRPPAWHEEQIGGRAVFWLDPSTDRASGISLVNYRTVVFFEKKDADADDDAPSQLIVAQTSTWAEDAVSRWDTLSSQRSLRMAVPTSKNVHWQAVIRWKAIYSLLSPYLTLAAGLGEEMAVAPSAEDLGDALTDSTINIRILYSGLDARHTGPLPLGAAYVPAVTAMSLSETSDPNSESSRERIACRNLRVLYHHAKLFKKDYERWPATVAELDGYVDFATHRHLLSLRPKDDGFLSGFVSMFTTGKEAKAVTDEDEESDIDDSLYEIDWSESDWKLRYRENEFVKYNTIYVDTEGDIHRVPKTSSDEKNKSKEKEKMAKR